MTAAFLLCLPLVCVPHPRCDDAPSPVSAVYLSETRVDLGRVQIGTTAETLVQLVNASPQPVTVRRVRTGCGCMVARSEESVVPPGGVSELSIRTRIPSQPGRRQSKTVQVFLEGYDEPLSVTVEGRSEEFISLSPPRLPAAADTPFELALTAEDRKPFRVLSTDPAVDGLPTAAATAHRLVIPAATRKHAQARRGIMFALDHPHVTALAVPVLRRSSKHDVSAFEGNAGSLQVIPRRLGLGSIRPGDSVEHQILLRGIDAPPESSPSIAFPADSPVQAQVVSARVVEDGLLVTLRFSLDSKSQARRLFRGALRVHLEHRSALVGIHGLALGPLPDSEASAVEQP